MDKSELIKAVKILPDYYKKFPNAMDIYEIQRLMEIDSDEILIMMMDSYNKNKYLDIKYPDVQFGVYDGGEIILRDGKKGN